MSIFLNAPVRNWLLWVRNIEVFGRIGTDSSKILDEDGSVFPTLLSKLEDAASIRTLVLIGHDFSLLHIPAEFPENLTTLVFDSILVECL